MEDDAVLLIVGLAFLGGGLLFVGVGAVILRGVRRFRREGVRAEGEVIEVLRFSDRDGTTFSPVLRYRDAEGVERTGRTRLQSSGYLFPVGTRMEILHRPGDPHVMLAEGRSTLFLPGVFLGLGAVFAVVGAALAWAGWA